MLSFDLVIILNAQIPSLSLNLGTESKTLGELGRDRADNTILLAFGWVQDGGDNARTSKLFIWSVFHQGF